MVGTSKILTVSYGTFSCTLEGFDDSFNTMKAIAEYFRGLAADDRYFGAEPPTPDAEMLARIAEREISRRVDARMEDDGIVLRAAELADQSAQSTPAEPEAETQAEAPASDEPAIDQSAASSEPAAKPILSAAQMAEKAAKRAARQEAKRAARQKERLAELARQKAEAEKVEAEKAEAEKVAAETTDAKTAASAVAGIAAAAKADLAQGDETPQDGTAQADDQDATTADTDGSTPDDAGTNATDASSVPSSDDIAPITQVPASPDPESVAAKLQRIRAVVGQDVADEEDTAAANDLSEDFFADQDTQDVADMAPEDDDPVADLDAHDAEMQLETAQDAAPSGSDMISRVMSAQAEDNADTSEDDATAPSDEKAAPRARVIRLKRSEVQKATTAGAEAEVEPETDVEAAAQEPAEPVTPDLGVLDGADELDAFLEDHVDTDTSEFEGVDLGIDDDQDDVEAVTDAEAEETDADAPANAFLSEDPQVDEEALDRLMTETDVKMQDPESSRRRDAISQLKAAVAAKEAARQVGEADDDGQDVENAFRNDLSEAVGPDQGVPRPRPVVRNSGQQTKRPRSAPLKLVAAQRVDIPKRDQPVTPRRVKARTEAPTQGHAAGSFGEFADNMGAKELPELLEAAAAYTAFVEGAEEFSRPQILRRVRAVASDNFNREDGLRSFADLLRAGRFTKVRNGRFQVADDTRFNPERQAS